jgi:long-subunit fatty acid transport protein
VLLALATTLALLAPAGTRANPLIDSRVGGLALVGPSVQHLASLYYNPATLTLLSGLHLFLDGSFHLGLGSVQRREVDGTTGAPTSSGALSPSQDLIDAFPFFFSGFAWDFNTDRVVISVSLFTPTSTHQSLSSRTAVDKLFDPAGQGAARYQDVDLTFFQLFVTAAGAVRLIDELSLGFSVSYVFGLIDYAFVRDAALDGGSTRSDGSFVALDDCGGIRKKTCGYENDAAAEAIRVRGQSNGLAFGVGLLGRPHPAVDIGVGWASRVVGVGGDDVPAKGDAWVRRAPAMMSAARWDSRLSGPLSSDLTGQGILTYKMPDAINVGGTWRVNERVLLDLQFRWLNTAALDNIRIRLSGTEFRAFPRVPDRIVHYRGFQDVYVAQLGGEVQITPTFQIQGGAMLETSAVPTEAVTATNIDGHKLDAFASVGWRIGRLVLRAGYGLVVMPTVTVESSVFSPSSVVECVDHRYDVDLPACEAAARGKGLPSTAGRYSLMSHRFDLSAAFDVW